MRPTLDEALEYVVDDELVEVATLMLLKGHPALKSSCTLPSLLK